MKTKETRKRRNYQAGHGKLVYYTEEHLIDGSDYGGKDCWVRSAFTPQGEYLGDKKMAHFLTKTKGISAFEKTDPGHCVCSIGFNKKEQKWYGWSHRAIYGFGIGYIVTEGSCTAESGWTDEYLAEHPEEDKSLPVGFTVKTLEDAKRAAIAFAESVS